MGTITTTDVANGQVTDASVINSNFTAVKTVVNGGLTNTNIDDAAAIEVSKLKDYPTDGSTVLFGDGTWGTLPGASTIAYSTTLDASPSDGQEAVLVDSTTAPTYVWRFRYNSLSASTYKWEFTGGSPVYARKTAQETSTSTSYGDLTQAVTVTLPRAGDYDVTFGVTNGSQNIWITPKLGSASASDTDGLGTGDSGGSLNFSGSKLVRATGLSAADVVKLQKKSTRAGTYLASGCWMSIVPVRVI